MTLHDRRLFHGMLLWLGAGGMFALVAESIIHRIVVGPLDGPPDWVGFWLASVAVVMVIAGMIGTIRLDDREREERRWHDLNDVYSRGRIDPSEINHAP